MKAEILSILCPLYSLFFFFPHHGNAVILHAIRYTLYANYAIRYFSITISPEHHFFYQNIYKLNLLLLFPWEFDEENLFAKDTVHKRHK
jgi:hypothetical protein